MAAGTQDVASLLARVPVFSEIASADLEPLAEVAVPRHFESGEAVFHEGDHGDSCYVVREGRARAVRHHRGGRALTLATFGPGEIFGELAVFADERRSATIEALGPLDLVAILGPDMRRVMREHPDIGVGLVAALGRRLRDTNEQLLRRSFQGVQGRVAGVLTELVLAAQAEGAGEAGVLVTATQADVAQLAGTSRESASRFLATLERAGVIEQGRGRLVVNDPAALERYVW